jgi:hypothetical protein
MFTQQQQLHRVKAPIVNHRTTSADNEKPLCSFYSKDIDDRFATYNSVTELLRQLARTSNDVIVANEKKQENSNNPNNLELPQELFSRIITDSNICQFVSSLDKMRIIKHILKKTETTEASSPQLSHLLFLVLRMLVTCECIRQEGWKNIIAIEILENYDTLLRSIDDEKEKSILKVFKKEVHDELTPPQISMESFSREIRTAERRVRLLSMQVIFTESENNNVGTGAPKRANTLKTNDFTLESFVDRSQVNLMEPLPVAVMKNKAPQSSQERPLQSPRAAEYLNSALKAMPNNEAIQSMWKKLSQKQHDTRK